MAEQEEHDDLIQFSHDLVEAAEKSDGPLSKLTKANRTLVVERYRKFLALAKRYPTERLAPTSDIDEVWHLHMLMPRNYFTDCKQYLGEILDHNGGFGRQENEVEELREVFKKTAKLWEKEFGEPYLGSGRTVSPLTECISPARQGLAYCLKRK